MKHIILITSLLLSPSIFSMDDCMDNRKLTIENRTNKQVTVSYKKVLPGRVQPKKEIIGQNGTAIIPLPSTNALQIGVSGYGGQKIYVYEYHTPVVICSGPNSIMILQGQDTLGFIRQ